MGYCQEENEKQIKLIQTPSKFLTLVQFIRYSLENGTKKI